MEVKVVSNSTLRRRARRDLKRTLQQISDDSSIHLPVNADDQTGEQVMDEIYSEHAEMQEHDATDIDMSPNFSDHNVDANTFDNMHADFDGLPQCSSSDCSESDDEDVEPCSLKDSICSWALTFGISLVALTALLSILRYYHPDLPKDARTILKTNTQYTIQNKFGGQYHYFGILSSIKRTLSQICDSLVDCFTLKLQINIDGLPLFKSTGIQLWPILGLLVSVPMKEPVIIALFCGPTKPQSADDFLKDFVVELQELEKGFDFNGKRLFLSIDCVICDAPAKAYVKNIKPHNGYYGCDKCVQRGLYTNRRMTFPLTDSVLRTDESFAQQIYEDHQNGPNPFHGCNVGMVSQFPLDYMHLVCLGVMRKLLLLWLRGPLNVRLSANVITQMSDRMKEMRPYIPVEFARKPRSFREIDRWKATEFRQFLLYIGPVLLPSFLSSNMYNNFMLLSTAIAILISVDLSSSYSQYSQTLLKAFVSHFGEIYGKDAIVYNVHGLVHLPEDVQKFGCLDHISAFPYENHLQKIKRLVRKPERPFAQIIRRLSERSSFRASAAATDGASAVASTSLKIQHFDGPIPDELDVKAQYTQLHTDKWTMKISPGNNIFFIGEDVCVIKNIVSCPDGIHIVYKVFSERSLFFQYPFRSDFLNIFCVSHPSDRIKCAKVSEVTKKCVALPHRGGFVVIPLLH